MNRNVRVSVIVLKGDELLVVRMHRKEKDIYVLAGGGLENGETLYEGGVREVKEETNLDVRIEKILYIKELYTDVEEAMDVILLGEIVGGELKSGYDPEHGEKQILKEVKFVKIS
jgi:8-oxo-dGTP diphosphatase